MPACFRLIDKTTHEPVNLVKVDERMCDHFKVTPDPVDWYCNWYNTIGLMLALGKDFQTITGMFLEERRFDKLACAAWLADNFIAESWCE